MSNARFVRYGTERRQAGTRQAAAARRVECASCIRRLGRAKQGRPTNRQTQTHTRTQTHIQSAQTKQASKRTTTAHGREASAAAAQLHVQSPPVQTSVCMHAASQSVPACLLCIVPTRCRLAGLGSGATFYNGNSRPYSAGCRPFRLQNARIFFRSPASATRNFRSRSAPTPTWERKVRRRKIGRRRARVECVRVCAAAAKVCRKANCTRTSTVRVTSLGCSTSVV